MELYESTEKYEDLFKKQIDKLRMVERDFRKTIESKPDASTFEKEHALKLLVKMQASQFPRLYDNVSISKSRGLETTRCGVLGLAVGSEPNGKKTCQIRLWSGVTNYESDPKKKCIQAHKKE